MCMVIWALRSILLLKLISWFNQKGHNLCMLLTTRIIQNLNTHWPKGGWLIVELLRTRTKLSNTACMSQWCTVLDMLLIFWLSVALKVTADQHTEQEILKVHLDVKLMQPVFLVDWSYKCANWKKWRLCEWCCSKNIGCFSLHFNFHFLQRMRIAYTNSVVWCAFWIIIAQIQMWR